MSSANREERAMKNLQKIRIPGLMYVYILLLGMINIGTGLWGLLFPMGMLNLIKWALENAGKSLTLEGTGKLFIIQLGAAGDFAIGVLFLMVLFLFRTRETLLSLFLF
jgi:hypothetical protein